LTIASVSTDDFNLPRKGDVALVLGIAAIAPGYFVFQPVLTGSNIHEFHFLEIVFAGLVVVDDALRIATPK